MPEMGSRVVGLAVILLLLMPIGAVLAEENATANVTVNATEPANYTEPSLWDAVVDFGNEFFDLLRKGADLWLLALVKTIRKIGEWRGYEIDIPSTWLVGLSFMLSYGFFGMLIIKKLKAFPRRLRPVVVGALVLYGLYNLIYRLIVSPPSFLVR